jgi:hypothetical protein
MTPPRTATESRERLLKDPRVERWYKNRATRSTADNYLDALDRFLRRNDIDLDGFESIARAQRDGKGKDQRFADLVLRWVENERKAGRPDSYLATNWAAVKSYLKSVEAAPSWTPKLKIRAATTISTERVPTPQELRAVLDRTSIPRTRAAILFLATTGVRPGVLASRATVDGLRLRDLPDLDVKKLEIGRRPFVVRVPVQLSKGGSAYFCFGNDEAAEAILAYLRLRRDKRDERLDGSSALFAPEPKMTPEHARRAPDGAEFLSEKGFSHEIRRALRKVQPSGVRWRPYVLRAFTSSQLMVAENAQLITRDYREFLLGHTADIGRRYNVAKGKASEAIENDLRKSYNRAADRYLRILTVDERRDSATQLKVELLKMVGYTAVEAESLVADEKSDVAKLVRAKLGSSASPEPQRIVSVEEAQSLLRDGWKVQTAVGASLVLNPPN